MIVSLPSDPLTAIPSGLPSVVAAKTIPSLTKVFSFPPEISTPTPLSPTTIRLSAANWISILPCDVAPRDCAKIPTPFSPVAATSPSTFKLIAPEVPAPPAVSMKSLLMNPPPPPRLCARIPIEPSPSAITSPVCAKLMSPPLPLLSALAATVMSDESLKKAPPPPPMDCRITPCESAPSVSIEPTLLTLMLSPFPDAAFCPPMPTSIESNPSIVAWPPPAPMLCSNRPGERSPRVTRSPV